MTVNKMDSTVFRPHKTLQKKRENPEDMKAKRGRTRAKLLDTKTTEAGEFLCAVTEKDLQLRTLKAP